MAPLRRRTQSSVVVLVWLAWFGSGAAQSDMFEVAMHGSLAEVRAATADVQDVDIRNDRSFTPLMHAALANPDPEVVRWLVSVGAAVNACTRTGITPLMRSASTDRGTLLTALLAPLGPTCTPATPLVGP